MKAENLLLFFTEEKSRNKRLLLRIILALCVWSVSHHAQAVSSEYKLKAAYLYQFTKFTQWPENRFENKTSPINICVLGRSPFGMLLDSFSRRQSQKRSILVEYLPTIKNIKNCHIVFISKSEEKRLPQILRKIEGIPMLSVSDMDSFAPRGGMIGFVPKKRKVGIEINVDAAQSAGAKISSKLIEISTVVQNRLAEESP